MRIDKYLKLSRIIKRRTVAKEVCNANRVLVNDRIIKSSYVLKIDDIIQITFGNKIVKVKVKKLLNHVTKEDSTTLYEVLEEIQKKN